jgi:hypothetical protein
MLNLEKCVFGVSTGKLLGYIVSVRGIEANLEKICAMIDMEPPTTLREMQKLTSKLVALGRFIIRLAEKCAPLF